MRIGYIILAHKHPEQLIRLVLRLNGPGSSFFIHVDRKTAGAVYGQMRHGLAHLSNVLFLPRHEVNWGDFGTVRASLQALRTALSRPDPFDYAVLMTGQDYPIKSNAYISEFLSNNSGSNFLEYASMPNAGWGIDGGLSRIESWHFRAGGRRLRIPGKLGTVSCAFDLPFASLRFSFRLARVFPYALQPFGGSHLWCLSRECARYVSDYVEQHPALANFCKYVHVPDEIFYHTIVLNSALKYTVSNRSLTYADWSERKPSPAVLRQCDFPALRSAPELFARKFDILEDADVLDMIDDELLGACPG